MANRTPSAKLTLSYPLYGCAFASNSSLVVGGGGGPGRNGVGNKLTLLDTSDATEISEDAELELSANEDNVTSLAVGPRKDRALTVFAGVNSSPEDIKKGKNQHFRVFGVKSAAKRSGEKDKISELARDALFVHKDADTYQRILRLSYPYEGLSQLGVIATGLSKDPQIAIFDVPSSGGARWKSRGRLDIPTEAMDLDVVQTGPDTYQLAYCTESDIFVVEVSKASISEPRCVFNITPDEGETAKASFKALRYLTPGFVFTVLNKPKSAGVALHGYRLPNKDQDYASLSVRAQLPRSVSKATGLAVRNLSPVDTPSDKQDDTQFVVAVAGNDSSISLFTMEHKSVGRIDMLANLAPFQVLKSVHPSNITGLSFSFAPPKGPAKAAPELYIKLASVAVGFTTVVHSIPLKKYIDKAAPARKGGPPKPSRYIVALKSKGESPTHIIVLLALLTLLMAIIGQTFVEMNGLSKPILHVHRVFPASWTVPLRKIPIPGQQKSIGDLLSDARPHHTQQLVIKHGEVTEVGPDGLPDLHVGIHDQEVHGPATPWENLGAQDRDLWKQRLQRSGHWVEDMGEAIFKGVLFGEIGGAIGNIVGEAL
ncbi:Uu.00g081550.m01.CDS01 [Anthostomella pinea]|uniref:Guanine nucleotide-exchange factor SEC12 n=1 Tax=Anthostomella pinea TaxID=933095 RepID=A0AAI8VL64_9PEZI|nr:Uu.00g081550.m01.CDS01 [Anthostomella pinea]